MEYEETLFEFKLDKQHRILLPKQLRDIYGFDDTVYMRLSTQDKIKYLQIAGYAMQFYQAMTSIDPKGRVILSKDIRQKMDWAPGSELVSYEDTSIQDTKKRSLYLALKKE